MSATPIGISRMRRSPCGKAGMRRYGDDPTGTPPLWLHFHKDPVNNKARSELHRYGPFASLGKTAQFVPIPN